MQRFTNSAVMKNMSRHLLRDGPRVLTVDQPCDVFINHRSIDTKKTFSGLLFQYLSHHDIKCFLNSKSMKPGDRLFDNINRAIHGCKVGVAVLSPRYCHSTYCLHELALMLETKKRVIPIFYDVIPSQLRVMSKGSSMACSSRDLERYKWALEETQNTVGLLFDPSKQDWSELLRNASNAVIKNLMEVEEENWSPSISNVISEKNPLINN
ncbi:hypothetical protein SAY86_007886 [Trapa natans]|uniref:TIR domain-containing protein n=1 Tax=Trapa natans TaxID=22666 RepID=A0AAN7QYA6_TRANT|nr:hypothetical protein SAY86_007886 [Trapa natans]